MPTSYTADASLSNLQTVKLARSVDDPAPSTDRNQLPLQIASSEVLAAERSAVPPKAHAETSSLRPTDLASTAVVLPAVTSNDRATTLRTDVCLTTSKSVAHSEDSADQSSAHCDDSDLIIATRASAAYDSDQDTKRDVASASHIGSGCMIVDGVINGHPCRVLLDTGASHSHIADQFVTRTGLTTSRLVQYASGLMANGSEQRIDRLVRHAELQLNGTPEFIDLMVMPMSNYNVILGMNWHRLHTPVAYHDTSVEYQIDDQRCVLHQSDSALQQIANCLISATQLRRMLKKPSLRSTLTSLDPSVASVYFVYVNAVEDKPAEIDRYKRYYEEQFPDVCSSKLESLPPNRTHDHRIELEPGAQPPNRAAYRESAALNDELKKQLTELLQAGVIRPSKSPFASPVLFVKKHDGTWRMCIDYRALNKVTKKNRYPLPHQDDLIERLRHANYLTKLDLVSGYWQVRMADDSIEKTAFTTRYGLYEWLVMPFGLCNAPSTFMQMMNDVLQPLVDKCVIVFLDDILIYSATEEQHYQDVSAVFTLLRQHQLRVKMSKCDFFKPEVEFLGHIVGDGSVKMCPSKIAAIVEWPTPRSTHDVRSFLGLCGYYRKFVQAFSKIATPLYALTKADTPFSWPTEADQAFASLKTAMTSAPVLALPDHDRSWIMYTDASNYGIGGVLCQDHGNGPQPVLFVSHKLGGAELNWPVHDKEMYAIIYMFKTCRWYVQDRHVTVYTDHRSLEHFVSQPTLSPRQTRWQQYLASYDWTIVYKAGKYNVVADGLSRRTDMQPASEGAEASLTDTVSVCAVSTSTAGVNEQWLHELQIAYHDDAWCQSIIDSKGTPVYTVTQQDDKVYIYRGEQLVIPNFDAAKKPLLQEAHDALAAGHRGAMATHHRLARHYYWQKMYDDIVTYCRECPVCQQCKNVTLRPAGLLQPLPVPSDVGDSISIDFVTKLPKTKRGHTGFLTIVDRLTKYIVLVPIRTRADHSVAMAHESRPLETTDEIPAAEVTFQLLFDHWIKHFGVPRSIVSDRDTQFMSKFWKAAHDTWGTKLLMTTAYHPEGDGQTERTHRTVEEVLRTLTVDEQDKWDRWLSHATIAVNTARSATTGHTPHYAVYGKEMRTPMSTLTDQLPTAPNAVAMVKDYDERIRELREQMLSAQQKQKLYADQKRRAEKFAVNDWVYVTTDKLRAPSDKSSKLKYKYAGPYRIVKQINEVTFELRLHENQSHKQPSSSFHVSKLRRFYPRLHRFADDRDDDVPLAPDIDGDGDEEYEVAEVLDKKRVGALVKYLIRWKGYSRYHDTWEPISHLQNAQELIDAFNSLRNNRATQQQADDHTPAARSTPMLPKLAKLKRKDGVSTPSNAYALSCVLLPLNLVVVPRVPLVAI